MLDEDNIPEVSEVETLARYLVRSNDFRADNTIKAAPFMPHPHVDLSVNRHLECTEDEIWAFGRQVSDKLSKRLYGRTDVAAKHCFDLNLTVNAAPIPGNPNHADVKGYPDSKPDQKSIAQKLAAVASRRITPPEFN